VAFEHSQYFSELKDEGKKRYEDKARFWDVKKIRTATWRVRITLLMLSSGQIGLM